MAASQFITQYAAKPVTEVFKWGPDVAKYLIQSTGAIKRTKQTESERYEKARQNLEWDNAWKYYEYLLDPELHYNVETKGVDEFVPDTLLDLPEFESGKELLELLQEEDSDLLKAQSFNPNDDDIFEEY